MKRNFISSISIAASVIFSCSQPTNRLASLDPNSNEFTNELAKQINSKHSNLHYTLDSYATDNGKEYLLVNIDGDNINTQSKIEVTNWNKLQNIKHNKGLGYRGAELRGLSVEVKDAKLVYKDLDNVVD